ncbi:beta-glucosidase family protein [Fodinicola acaciae]|uniref:beta-glucosidase family protein n=1 Tax=Fodinicola acaciae TaxID=2681555 RepID=UPI0013D2FA80|nr:glycoside hydrolase family 3 C-terminal domain-containing protein [Fodinicola acaciae]
MKQTTLRAVVALGAIAALLPVAQPVSSGRVASLVRQLTLDEKLSFLHGIGDPRSLGQSGYLPGVPRLGIPEVRMADGAAGIRVSATATALPAPVMLASTFDQTLAKRHGAVIGRDGRALKMDVLLGPTVGVIRQPYGGRNFESYSEDPLVSANTVAGHVQGVQSQGMIATVKHYAENNQEANRDGIDVTVGEQALHEIELPGFKAAVDAGAGSVMCAYNQVNGEPACGNSTLLRTILKEQWGFRGWVMSDWDATHSTDSLVKGLDMEMPEGVFLADKLKAAVLNGAVPMSAVDAAVTRILTQFDGFGLLDGKPRPTRDRAGAARVAQRVAEQGAVLLKNRANTLPLRGDGSIAVIGPTAKTPKVSGGGSGKGNPDHANAPVDTIRARAGGRTVTYAPGGDLFGTPIPASAVNPPLNSADDGTVTVPGQYYAGALTAPVDGDYRISIGATAPDQLVQLIVDDRNVIAGAYGLGDGELPTHLTKGPHKIVVIPITGPHKVRLGLVTPAETRQLIRSAAAAAKRATTAVVFVYDDESEGLDRPSLSLATYQDELVSEVAKANPRTVVVLNTGSSVAMPWLGQVKSVLDMYYPGQQGGEATAALLFGDAAPGGRLTQTFPLSEKQTPVAGDPRRYPGVGKRVDYGEGIEVGYRWYDAHGVKPLFPFGFGLTYTSFAYGGLAVVPDGRGGADAWLTVRNTGSRTGDAVPQVYLGPSPRVTEPQAVRSLAGYQKVTLRPGELRRLRIHLDAARFRYWDTTSHSWAVGAGVRDIFAGPSSADLPLHGRLNVR